MTAGIIPEAIAGIAKEVLQQEVWPQISLGGRDRLWGPGRPEGGPAAKEGARSMHVPAGRTDSFCNPKLALLRVVANA